MSNDCNLCELKIPSESPEMAVFNVFNNFIEQLVECADENWCPSHVEMIKRLILSVLSGVDYAEVDEHMICDFFEQYCSDEKNLNHAFHENNGEWISIMEQLPPTETYILLSFSNFSVPIIGRYEEDDNGNGNFYAGDEDETLLSQDMYVNAWQPLPEPYSELITGV